MGHDTIQGLSTIILVYGTDLRTVQLSVVSAWWKLLYRALHHDPANGATYRVGLRVTGR
jgi:hypothetical protein